MKINKSILVFGILVLAVLWAITGCGTSRPDFSDLVQSDPAWLMAKADSLNQACPDDEELIQALNQVYLAGGTEKMAAENWPEAIISYEKALDYIPRQKEGRYGLAMAQARAHYKKGGPNDLWEALTKFSEAAVIDTSQGEPYLWLGRSYEKKDENDFELILEAYDKALNKRLIPELEKAALEERENVKHRQDILEAFWK